MQLARVGALVGAVTAAVAATVFAAVPASAHTPKLVPGCEGEKSTLSVQLLDYNDRHDNHVTVTLGDAEVLEDNTVFGKEFKETYTESSNVELTFTVEVSAWDDPEGEKDWSFTKTVKVPSCVKTTSSTTTTTTTDATTTTTDATTTTTEATTTTTEATTTTTESSTTTSPAATTTTTDAAVVPIAEESPLASTGASIAVPLIIGLVLLGGGAAVLIVQRRRAAKN